MIRYEDSEEIYKILDNSAETELFEDLIEQAIRYSRIRTDWIFLTFEERMSKDPSRTSAHNVFIDKCNILARNMEKNGENIEWRKKLGTDRKVIGDFACYLHSILGILSR